MIFQRVKAKLAILSLLLLPVALVSCGEENTTTTKPTVTTTTSSEDSTITYHVIFQNYDLTILYETDVNEGEDAVYDGKTPTKEEDDEFTYEFKGWDKELTNIQEDITFTAQYNSIPKEDWGPIHWF
ncbi:MAG: hypothetical protein IJ194_00370 [Bacilli bacterium]|nr:hypothetical protein [Bacilli bacterium]